MVPVGSVAPASTDKPVVFLRAYPGEEHLQSFIKQVTLGDTNVVPILRVSRIVKKYSSSPLHYARLTHAVWNTVGHETHGKRLLTALREDDNRELLQTIHDVQDLVSTDIAKKKSLVMLASPTLSLELLQSGYRVLLARRDFEGKPLPRDPSVINFLLRTMESRKDVCPGWRKWVLDAPSRSREFIWHESQLVCDHC